MKKIILTSIILIFVLIQGYGQKRCDIKSNYEDFISVERGEYEGRAYLTTQVVETQKKSCFSDLINNNPFLISYLLQFASVKNHKNILEITDSIDFKRAYFEDLRNDSLFNAIMVDLVSKTIDKTVPKDTVSFDEILNIAVKYFYIRKINEEGYYAAQICGGLNAIEKTEAKREPFLEAFSFSSIQKNMLRGGDFNIYEEFINVVKELYLVNLGIDDNENLLRAQGATFMLMRNNENLRKMLKADYENQKEFLPFVVIEN